MPSTSNSFKETIEDSKLAKIIKELQKEMELFKSDIDLYATLIQAGAILGFPVLFLGLIIAAVAIFFPAALLSTIALSVVAALIYSMVMINLPQEEYQKKISDTLKDYLVEDIEKEFGKLEKECNFDQSSGPFFKPETSKKLDDEPSVHWIRRPNFR